MAKTLIEKGADVTLQDSHGKNVMEYAKKAKFPELTQYLTTEFKKVKEIGKSNDPSQEQLP